METVRVKFLCNPPAGFRGKINFMFAIDDETIAEGYAGDEPEADLPKGAAEIQVLVRNEGLNSMSGSTRLFLDADVTLRIKYALFGKKAMLVPEKK